MQRRAEWLMIVITAFVMLAYLFSLWPRQDAELVNLGICLDIGSTPLEESVVTSDAAIYVCGTIEGTTSMVANIALYRGEEFIDFRSRKLRLGPFYERIAEGGSLPPGDYMVDVSSFRFPEGQTEFRVVD